MKKNTLKIITSIFTVICLGISIFSIIKGIQHLKLYNSDEFWFTLDKGYFVTFEIYRIVFWIICCLSNILLFCIINFKGLKFLTNSLIEQIKEHREKTAEERKTKKQAKLQAEIAQKQAELEEMKNE